MGSSFTVFFDGTFWVGVVEIAGADGVRAARHVFGAEPSSAELADFVRYRAGRLLDLAFAAPVVPLDSTRTSPGTGRPPSPKRLARAVAKESRVRGASTAAQAALSAAREEGKVASSRSRKERREEQGAARRAVLAAKRKARHRGR